MFGKLICLAAASVLTSCDALNETMARNSENIQISKGPPIEDIVTPFDEALICMKGLVPSQLAFSVGVISDNTGKEQYADSGTGKVVTQGAADIVQSALFRAGVKVVNRRDASIAITETNWGIRNIKQQTPAAFFLTGSINSLDYIPGGGVQVEIAGVGPRYRENRILVGLDLALTDTATGEVVANVPLQKQIFSRESGGSVGRFFGKSLVNIDAGAMQREAMNATLRQMLNYATFKLLGQVVSESGYQNCALKVAAVDGTSASSDDYRSNRGALSRAAGRDISPAPPEDLAQAQSQAVASPPVVQKPVSAEAKRRGERATSLAAQAIAKAEATQKITKLSDAAPMRDEAVALLTASIAALREAAAMGLSGAEGDGVALVVEQAIKAVQAAQAFVQALEKVSAPAAPPPPASDGTAGAQVPPNAALPGGVKK